MRGSGPTCWDNYSILFNFSLMRHLILLILGSYLENKEELIITGVQILFSDQNLKVKLLIEQKIPSIIRN